MWAGECARRGPLPWSFVAMTPFARSRAAAGCARALAQPPLWPTERKRVAMTSQSSQSSQAGVNPKIFGAYDVRGVYPTDLNDETVYRIGRAFAQYLGVERIAVGHDMRVSSPALAQAFMRGITDQGTDAIDLGMTTTDELYFAVGKYGYPGGAMITASHNPKQYNGIKMCRADAVAISSETGGFAIRDLAVSGQFAEPTRTGQITQRDVSDAFVAHCLSFIDVAKVK